MSTFIAYLVLRRHAGLFARLRDALADPFALLHRFNWSAPWLERKMCAHED